MVDEGEGKGGQGTGRDWAAFARTGRLLQVLSGISGDWAALECILK